MTPTASPDAVQDFDAAKTIYGALEPLPKVRQERVVRWVTEALGLSAGSTPTAPTPAPSTPQPPRPDDVPLPTPSSGKTVDVQTFVREKQPQSDIQFVTAIAYYYRFKAPVSEQRMTIDAAFAQEATRLAGRSRLGRPRKALANAKSKGYLDSAARGQFAINTVGENMVESLPTAVTASRKARASQPVARSARDKKKAGPNQRKNKK